jgi:rubrerythrin
MSATKTDAVKLTTTEDRILNGLLEKGIRELKPKRTDHKITYSDLEEIAKDLSEKDRKRVLKSLALKGYMTEKDFDAALICPNCASSDVFTRYNCPNCQSINIKKVQLVEHPKCGFIGNFSEFEKDDQLICPKCNMIIGNPSTATSKQQQGKTPVLKTIGSSFECDKCGSKFDRPLTSHICQNCSASFNFREANYERLPAYELTDKVDTLAPNTFMTDTLRQLEKIIQNKGYTVELNAKIKGRSGFEQTFDLIAKKGDETILLDVSSWGNQNDLIALLGKKMDVESNAVILIDLAGNPNLTILAKPYNITVLDGREGKMEEEINKTLTNGAEKETKRPSFFRRGK